MKDKNIKKIINLLFNVVGFTILLKLGRFEALSYIFGLISVYLSRWTYNG